MMEAAETPRARSERILEALGFAVETGPDVDAVCKLLAGLTTRGGHSRRIRLENCGVAFPVMRAEVLSWERRGCKDRFCPDCARALSQQRAKLVRDFWYARADTGRRGAFLTLTRPKVRGESPREAARAVLADWRRLAHGETHSADGIIRSRTKRVGPPLLPGGLRSLELTARAENTVLNEGTAGEYRVKVGGIHAHLHVVCELAPGVTMSTLAARVIGAWRELTGGSAGAQDVQVLKDANIYQAVKYSTDFAALATLQDVAPAYARSVAEGLHGVRTADAWGTWRGILKPTPTGLAFGDRSLASLVLNCEGRVCFGPGVSEPATEVLVALASAKRYKDLRKREVTEALERAQWQRDLTASA